jgi:hypothetical protein
MEILRERVQMLRDIDDYVGKFYSNEWVRRNLLYQTDDEIKEIDQQIADEEKAGIMDPEDQNRAAETER